MMYIFLFLLGLAFGSFINVISLRFNPEGEFLFSNASKGRSHCPHCHKTLSWYELIPIVSYLIQGGQCRSCKKNLTLQYPLIELLTGIIFIAVPWYIINHGFALFAPSLYAYQWPVVVLSALWIIIFLTLILLSLIDLKHFIIPDSINLFLIFFGIIVMALNYFAFKPENLFSFVGYFSQLFGLAGSVWVNHLVAALVGAVFFALIIILSRGRAMGWGDFKLIIGLGLIFGWPDIIMILALSFIIGSIFGLGLIMKKRKTMKDVLPFGPFLVLASAIVFFFGFDLMSAYFHFFNIIY